MLRKYDFWIPTTKGGLVEWLSANAKRTYEGMSKEALMQEYLRARTNMGAINATKTEKTRDFTESREAKY